MMKLYDLILISARKYINIQRKDGSFSPGISGPWYDKASRVRNTAHIALILYKSYKITKKKKYLSAALKACDFIMLDKNRPEGFNFYCREGNDPTNGVIGVAWALEPLIIIGREQNIKKYIDLAERLIEMHKFNKEKKIWHVLNLDGTAGYLDMTMNHQLWFGAVALITGKAAKNKRIIRQASSFFTNLAKNMHFLEKGLMDHVLKNKGAISFLKSIAIKIIETFKGNPNFRFRRSYGYLAFNMQGLALTHHFTKHLDIWKDKNMRKLIKDSLNYLIKNYPLDLMEGPEGYGWAYNPTGIETAFGLQEFSDIAGINDSKKEKEKWISTQMKYYFNIKTGLMDKNTCDKVTSSARLYEAVFLDNINIIDPTHLKN